MVTRRIVLVATAMLVCAGWVQSRPNFNGTWRVDGASSPGANLNGVAGGGFEMSIVQDGSTITFIRPFGRGQASFRLPLDGKATTLPDYSVHASGVTAVRTARAVWDSNKLVIDTTTRYRDASEGFERTIQTKEVLRLDGPNLMVERARVGQAKPVLERYRR